MSQAIVRQALEIALNTWAASQTPVVPVAWQNVEFIAPAGRYARAFLLPSPTASDTLDKTHRLYAGIFQISLVMPAGTGSADAEALLSSLVTAFAPQTPLVRSGVTVYIIEPMGAASAIQEADRYVIPVSAPYQAHVI